MPFIDPHSWKSFLSTAAKKIQEVGDFRLWVIQGRPQLICLRPLEISDLPFLEEQTPFNFYYFSESDLNILKQSSKLQISKHLDPDVCLDLSQLNFSGSKYKGIRHSLNRAGALGLVRENKLRNLEDVLIMLKRWDETSGERHFQSRTGKNTFFFKNNFHQDCLNSFFYLKDQLVAFSVLSPPIQGHSSYVIGKALCLDYRGLSEFADIESYKYVQPLGVKWVNLGGGASSVVTYKTKFPGITSIPSYDGKAIIK